MRFGKRKYNNPGELLGDIKYLFKNRDKMPNIRSGALITPAFRERIMLAVTAVNGCRYCSYFHTGEALKSGLSKSEISQLLSGSVPDCPEEEASAVIYAQHWAESNACPAPAALSKLREVYGPEKSDAINLVLHMIRIGNLMGNSWDYMLYRVSFGHWGR